jgi:uncharacterized membrane protein
MQPSLRFATPYPIACWRSCGRFVADAANNSYERTQSLLWRVALVARCHQRPDRSYVFHGRQVPLCARCLGMLVGAVLVPLYCTNLRFAATLIAAMLLDGLTQAMHLRESRNWLRLLTGVGFALGCGGFLLRACHYLWNI